MKARKLYNRLKNLRVERGISRKELADHIGVNPQTVGYLERQDYNPSLDLAFRVSEFFGFPIEFIFATDVIKPMSQELQKKFPKYQQNKCETNEPETRGLKTSTVLINHK